MARTARPPRFTPAPLLLAGALVCVCAIAAAPGNTPAPPPRVAPQEIDLAAVGYKPVTSGMILREGFSTVTLDFVDDDDVLLTYAQRKLVPRLKDHDTGHQDRLVRAVVLHLPDARVERETEWRSHDFSRYLWPLSGGRFLVRIENSLDVLDAAHKEKPPEEGGVATMERRLLLNAEGQIESVQVSPSGDLVLVETTPAKHIGDDPVATEKQELPVVANFYAVEPEHAGSRELRVKLRGRARSPDVFGMAFTSFGVLETVREDREHWGFDFRGFDGKVEQLAGFTSTCRPDSSFVSDGEFFSAGCRGGEDRRLLAGFNLLGEPSWVFTTDDVAAWVALSGAPSAGRFAFRNTLLRSAVVDPDHVGEDDVRTQQVRVYNMRDGAELLRVPCSPAMRPTGNFALSPSGRKLAVLQDGKLMVYPLPPPSKDDLRKLEETAAAIHRHDAQRTMAIESVSRAKR